MATEIERKFLVMGEGWRVAASPGETLRQGYLARTPRGVVRVRLGEGQASLTVKGRRRGIVREEFTYPIPVAEAQHMLARLCVTPILEKVRHLVPHAGLMWQVDVYAGAAAGLVLAEVELARPDQDFEYPDWVGPEVTHDLRYRNSSLAVAGAPSRVRRTLRNVLIAESTRTP